MVDDEPELVLARARAVLKGKRFRLAPPTEMEDYSVSAERGYLREACNLVFHVSVVVVLLSFAALFASEALARRLKARRST